MARSIKFSDDTFLDIRGVKSATGSIFEQHNGLGGFDTVENAFLKIGTIMSDFVAEYWYVTNAVIDGSYSLIFINKWGAGYVSYLFTKNALYFNNYYSNVNHIQQMI